MNFKNEKLVKIDEITTIDARRAEKRFVPYIRGSNTNLVFVFKFNFNSPDLKKG